MRLDPFVSLLGFIVSPPGLLALVVVLVVLPLFVVYPLYWSRQTRKTQRHFGARLTYPAANLVFDFRGRPVRLQRTSSGRYGWYPTLTLGTSSTAAFYIGNPDSPRYKRPGWLRGPEQTVVAAGRQLLVASTSDALRREAARSPAAFGSGDLFTSQFASLHFPPAREYASRTFRTSATALYQGIDAQTWADPQRLQLTLERLCAILEWAEAVEGRDTARHTTTPPKGV